LNWIQDRARNEPGFWLWSSYDFRKKYPEFERWEKREEGGLAESDRGSNGIYFNGDVK